MAQVILLLTVITKMFMEYYYLPETNQTLEVFIPRPLPHFTNDKLKPKEVKKPAQEHTAGK